MTDYLKPNKCTVYISVPAYTSTGAPPYTVPAGCSCLALTCIPAIHSQHVLSMYNEEPFSGCSGEYLSIYLSIYMETGRKSSKGEGNALSAVSEQKKRSTKVYECINDPGAVSSILSNALTSSYFILSLAFICLSIILLSLNPPSPLVSTLLPCHPHCQNLPMLLSLNLTLVPSPHPFF